MAIVSTHTSFVRVVIASRTASLSVAGTKAVSTPNRDNTRVSSAQVPPYTPAAHTTWSPADRALSRIAAVAADPEPNASASSARSSAATASANAVAVGLPIRLYEKPSVRPARMSAYSCAMPNPNDAVR